MDRRARQAAFGRLKLTVDEKGRTAVVPLPGAERLPALLEFRGERLVRKSELHVTVIGSRGRYDGAALRGAARGLEFTVKRSGSYRLVAKGERRCLIELVDVPEREEYCVRLERALGLPANAVPRLPSHVTLFTEPGGRGIGLYSAAELEELSSRVTGAAELDALAAATAALPRGSP